MRLLRSAPDIWGNNTIKIAEINSTLVQILPAISAPLSICPCFRCQQVAMNFLGNVASKVIGEQKGELAQSLFDVGFGVGAKAGVILPYSRKHEYEADKIGMYLMDIAGYDVNAAPQFWERMLDGKGAEESDFLSTHPSDAKRIAALREAIRTKPNFK